MEPCRNTTVCTLCKYNSHKKHAFHKVMWQQRDKITLTGWHIFHGELALDQIFTMRPLLDWARYRTPIRGLYLCGSGTHPGDGLTGGSGAIAAREILKDLKK